MTTITRPTPEVDHAAGMLAALKQGHSCGVACTGQTTLGDGTILDLTCPYGRLDVHDPADRRLIGSIYAIEALAVLRGVKR